MYLTTCKFCGTEGSLRVMWARVFLNQPLSEDGFDVVGTDTTDEQVSCVECGADYDGLPMEDDDE